MKKIIFVCLLFLPFIGKGQAMIALLFGNKITNNHTEMGLFFAAQDAYIDGSGSMNLDIKFGIGAYTDFKLFGSEKWFFSNYFVFKSPKGGRKIPFDEHLPIDHQVDINPDIERRLSYLELTPMMRYQLSPSWAIAAGALVGYCATAKDIYTEKVDNEDGVISYKYDIKKYIQPWDAGLVVDLQYRLLKGKGLRINGRYSYSFTNIYKPGTGLKGSNAAIEAGVGIQIGGKEKVSNAKEVNLPDIQGKKRIK